MIIATGVIALAFLEVPLDGKLLGLISVDGVSPPRAWFAALALLGYFFLRFHLEPESRKQRTGWKQAYENSVSNLLNELIPASLPRTPTDNMKQVRFQFPSRPDSDFMLLQFNCPYGSLNKWKGKTIVAWQKKVPYLTGAATDAENTTSSDCVYHVRFIPRWKIRWKSAKRAGLFDWTALEVAVPYVLTGVAAAIALYKLSFYTLVYFGVITNLAA